ncbi:MAG: SDR family NAD(P)-dependent oxidoreductase [Dehalococcoidales bacterium]|nr:SDR family NAD(P)-dependent oxidoreductase [Dehalococcoidales bacterium]
MGKLEGQVALITGASSGMGRATALAFAEEGAKLAIAARRQGALEELATTLQQKGAEVIWQATDVSKLGDVEAIVRATVERFGRLDVLVNAAGINAPNRTMKVMTPELWDRIINTNLNGAFHCTHAVLPQMRRQQGGTIIHITSVSGKWGDISGAAYQASKHGMVGLSYGTMFEERENGIRMTLIFPGLCNTEILRNRQVPFSREMLDKMMKPEDIAAACVFAAGLPSRTYVAEIVMMPGALQCVGHAAV